MGFPVFIFVVVQRRRGSEKLWPLGPKQEPLDYDRHGGCRDQYTHMYIYIYK